MTDPDGLLRRLANRDRVRSEATLQADIRQLLLTGGLGLAEHDLDVELEAQLTDRRRIDIEVGYTVIEVKKDLRSAGVAAAAEGQLAGYVAARSEQTGQRYVGVLTDGAEWRAYQLRHGELAEATRHTLSVASPDGDVLLFWLEGVLATRQNVPPTPGEIAARLGATSASHALDRATLTALYAAHAGDPTVQLKRELWASLLRSALGTQFTNDDELFLEHTLLVNSAEVIAHLVVGLDATDLQPATLLGGQRFDLAGLYGVVERDFFDWVLEVPGGAAFVRTMARRLARFDWSAVEYDVLKVLYESIIGAQTRKRLGEYYTPDWLAEHTVASTVTAPLTQRVLDPACGSGSFLFHAVRRYLAAAAEAGRPLSEALGGLTDHVLGVDLHPVAVALARVTYLLAIGRDRLLDPQRGPVTVPVYLGDSVQWQQQLDLYTDGYLVVPTGTGGQLFDAELRFPDELLADAASFDQLVTALADQAAKPRAPGVTPTLPAGLVHRLAIAPGHRPAVEENFRILCRLHDEGRDHIWSYYVRNLARPVWLSRPENRVDVLVGNPPWLSYRHMPAEMQVRFRQMSQDRHLWHGREVATQQDLSGLFIARATQQYLTDGGAFAFVVPNALLDRDYFTGFRSGHYPDPVEPITVEFTGSWDLRRLRPHFFPRGAAVVFGRRSTAAARPLSMATERWTGRLPRGADTWAAVGSHITRVQVANADAAMESSPYAPQFSNGATIYPRVLFMVRAQQASPLGLAAGRRAVKSARSSTEKAPWKTLPDLEGVVEAEFIRPVLFGETLLPYRLLPTREAVLPLEAGALLDNARLDRYPGLADWWRGAEQRWLTHRSRSTQLTLRDQLDYRGKLTGQLPAPALRVAYGASGMYVVAALVDDPRAIIDKSLYWGTVTSRAEGHYLCAILNSPALTDLVRPLMAYGKDERHVDKNLWKLPISRYDETDPQHRHLAELGQACVDHIRTLELDESGYFVPLRRRVRVTLAAYPPAVEANELVVALLTPRQ
ncbi:MAG: N-6 DNA methylase [Pseudonocardiaceae bacterium]|nr:N-6 DNA methylase [Pseudonocardiaceae bacterium]